MPSPLPVALSERSSVTLSSGPTWRFTHSPAASFWRPYWAQPTGSPLSRRSAHQRTRTWSRLSRSPAYYSTSSTTPPIAFTLPPVLSGAPSFNSVPVAVAVDVPILANAMNVLELGRLRSRGRKARAYFLPPATGLILRLLLPLGSGPDLLRASLGRGTPTVRPDLLFDLPLSCIRHRDTLPESILHRWDLGATEGARTTQPRPERCPYVNRPTLEWRDAMPHPLRPSGREQHRSLQRNTRFAVLTARSAFNTDAAGFYPICPAVWGSRASRGQHNG